MKARPVPGATTAPTSWCVRCAMKPRMEKTTVAENTLVTELVTAIRTASRWQLRSNLHRSSWRVTRSAATKAHLLYEAMVTMQPQAGPREKMTW